MVLARKAPRPKKCRACRATFTPARHLQAACSVPCALTLAQASQQRERAAQARQERAERKAAKERIKTKGDHLKDAQAAFNEWVRLRDAALPCISCGRYHDGQWHAGHYRTVGSSPELRFEPLNVHKQCAPCNNHKSGDIVNYRINLVKRIGGQAVEWLEGPHKPKRYSIDEIKAIKAEYRAKARALKKEAA